MIENPKKEGTKESLIYYTALLAGLGARVQSLVDELPIDNHQLNSVSRTCIDAGNTLMFSLLAPAGRSLRLLSRLPDSIEEPGVNLWMRTYVTEQGPAERWMTRTFMGESALAWQHALRVAQSVGGEETFRRLHGILGPRGRIYDITASQDSNTPRGWVGWQMDRRSSPEEALTACGVPGTWRAAVPLFEQVLGHSVHQRYGPWSISWTLDSEQPFLRIGTTGWARIREDEAKRKRLVSTVTSMGGDGRFAEALYKLIDADRPPHLPSRIGRAIEIEFIDDQLHAVEFYLCVPW